VAADIKRCGRNDGHAPSIKIFLRDQSENAVRAITIAVPKTWYALLLFNAQAIEDAALASAMPVGMTPQRRASVDMESAEGLGHKL
jgi:hypothetical protein